ncbi:2-hydroxyacyl-CoA dehydratase [Thermodesulfobacteriota bacterium]
MREENGVVPLKTPALVRANQKEWFVNVQERARQGEPFAICNGDDFEEILNIMDIPFMVINYWHALIIVKGMAQGYKDILTEKDYPEADFAVGLACTMDNNPETAPWGGLPKPSIIIGGGRTDTEIRILELWARECGCEIWPLEYALFHGIKKPPGPRWWERIRGHWDELIDPHNLDLRVEEEKQLIRHLEVTYGRKFSITRLSEAMQLINEQMDYWRKAHDLIAETVPCPVSVRDQLAMYQATWHRGTVKGRDFIKAYYEEVKERVENGIAACPNEKLRLMWMTGTPAPWARWAEEKYGAVCVASSFSPISINGYPREVLNNDPLRALASRHMLLFWFTPDWVLREAKLNQCNGCVIPGPPDWYRIGGRQNAEYFEQNGMPLIELPSHSTYRDDDEVRSVLSEFIETRLLS